MRIGLRLDIRGIVQGVGFRPWVCRLALAHGITGRVWNHAAGVTIEAFGDEAAMSLFARALSGPAPPAARIERIGHASLDPAAAPPSFTIAESAGAEAREVSIPPDLALCGECLAEVNDAAARRHRYPFTNCTSCGPRFTIALDVPYDRHATTMAPFAMCEACRAEYENPADRRFHAQPIACPRCGPRLRLLDPSGADLRAPDPLEAAAAFLRRGDTVGVKGLGGYLLACDATSPAAVSRLRARKRREHKPFAVMVATLADAERLAVLDAPERALLSGVEAPIVLCRARHGHGLAPDVAPDTPLLGLFLAYTPLHRLLVDAAGGPLVMTSGNVSEEPLAYRDDEAVRRLAGLADALLAHDRGIAAPCDDSVARVIAGAPMIFRRARGYVPRAVTLRRPVPRPILGCGALLKNTFCLASGHHAWIGPHVGDLDGLATATFFEEGIDRLSRFMRVTPEVFAHDLHPDLHSTHYARARGGAAAIGVQHHHAHVAAVMAEHGLDGPVIGVAYDGTGHGTDGAAWGGEVLLVEGSDFRRFATFRPLALAGGDVATTQVWRLALAMIDDAFGGQAPVERLAVFRDVAARELAIVRQMLGRGVNCPPAHGVGRYFDAFGALGLARPVSHYEGQVAIAWNHAAETMAGAPAWAFDLDSSGEVVSLDLRAAIREFTMALIAGEPAERLAARFHTTLVAATVALVERAVAIHGPMPVVLGGGCFQNLLLAEGLLAALSPRFEVWLPRQAPPGDGGISLGQVMVAAARAN